jgi:hypothetical protein
MIVTEYQLQLEMKIFGVLNIQSVISCLLDRKKVTSLKLRKNNACSTTRSEIAIKRQQVTIEERILALPV